MKAFGTPEINFHESKGGAHMIGEYIFKDHGVDVQKGDTIGLRLFFQNSYRADASVKLSVAGLRLTCLNGMTAYDNEFNIAFRHTKRHIEDGKFKDLLLPEPEEVVKQFKKSARSWTKLHERELKPADLDLFMQQAVKEGIITKSILDEPTELEENSAWGLYNKLTWWITHKEKATAQMSGKISRLNRIDRWFAEQFIQ
jgi:hypothetical protein